MKKCLLFFIAIITLSLNVLQAQNVGIGTITPHSSAALDISSTNKGLLIPRMTTSERNAMSSTAAEGLLVFDLTEKKLYQYNGGLQGWLPVSKNLLPENGLEEVTTFGGRKEINLGGNLRHNTGIRLNGGNTSPPNKFSIYTSAGGLKDSIVQSNHNTSTLITLSGISQTFSYTLGDKYISKIKLKVSALPNTLLTIQVKPVWGGDQLGQNYFFATGYDGWIEIPFSVLTDRGQVIITAFLQFGNAAWYYSTANPLPDASASTGLSDDFAIAVVYDQNEDLFVARNRSIGIGLDPSYIPTERLEVAGNVKITGTIINEPWQTPTMNSGWTNFDANSFSSCGFYKDKEERVHLRGLVNTTNPVSGSVIFTLPVGYRPSTSKTLTFITSNNGGGVGRINIETNGDVMVTDGATGWFSLCNISFRAD